MSDLDTAKGKVKYKILSFRQDFIYWQNLFPKAL